MMGLFNSKTNVNESIRTKAETSETKEGEEYKDSKVTFVSPFVKQHIYTENQTNSVKVQCTNESDGPFTTPVHNGNNKDELSFNSAGHQFSYSQGHMNDMTVTSAGDRISFTADFGLPEPDDEYMRANVGIWKNYLADLERQNMNDMTVYCNEDTDCLFTYCDSCESLTNELHKATMSGLATQVVLFDNQDYSSCYKMEIEEMGKQFLNQGELVRFLKTDSKLPGVGEKYHSVGLFPIFVMFHNDLEVDRMTGPQVDANLIEKRIKSQLETLKLD